MALLTVTFMTVQIARAIWIIVTKNFNDMLGVRANARFVWAFMVQLIFPSQRADGKRPRDPMTLNRRSSNIKHSVAFFLVPIAAPEPAGFSFLNEFPESLFQSRFCHATGTIT